MGVDLTVPQDESFVERQSSHDELEALQWLTVDGLVLAGLPEEAVSLPADAHGGPGGEVVPPAPVQEWTRTYRGVSIVTVVPVDDETSTAIGRERLGVSKRSTRT